MPCSNTLRCTSVIIKEIVFQKLIGLYFESSSGKRSQLSLTLRKSQEEQFSCFVDQAIVHFPVPLIFNAFN